MTAGGKDKKKLMFLGGLGVVLAIVMYVNLFSGPDTPAADHPAAVQKAAGGAPITMADAAPKSAARPKVVTHGRSDEFHPIYVPTRPEDRKDPTTIDPTMRFDLLAKVQSVEAAGGVRNLFAFGAPPPVKVVERPKGPEPILHPTPPAVLAGQGALPDTHDAPVNINLKYYGIVSYSQGGAKTACFLDRHDDGTEEILLGSEGDTLKRRYRVVKIGTSSVVMQDTESKREQTLPLAMEPKS